MRTARSEVVPECFGVLTSPSVDFVMSSPRRLHAAVSRLREAGYTDASEGNRQSGDAEELVLRVSPEVGCQMQVAWIVTGADPESRPL